MDGLIELTRRGRQLRRWSLGRSQRRGCRRNRAVPMPEQIARSLRRRQRGARFVDPAPLAVATLAAHRRSRQRRGDDGLRGPRDDRGRSRVGGLTPVEALVLVLFALNFGWIALTFATAIAGAVIVATRGPRAPESTGPHRTGARPC